MNFCYVIDFVDRIGPGSYFYFLLKEFIIFIVDKMSAFGPCKRKFIGKYSYYCSNILG